MRKITIAFAVLSMAASLASCQMNEFRDEEYTPEKGEIVFTLAKNVRATKSTDSEDSVKGAVIPLESKDGIKLYLEETITDLNDIAYAPQTKGTPAFTENFSALYGDFKAAAYKYKTSDNAYQKFDDGVFEKVDLENKELWRRRYGDAINESSFPLYFFLRAPYAQEGTTVKELNYYPIAGTVGTGENAKTVPEGGITFTYDGSTLTTAEKQVDLLFTSRKVESGEYAAFTNNKTGIPVLFHHALTGVKFANFFSNPELETRTFITKVEITGLADGGKCIVKPRQENNGYVDIKIDDYSSEDTEWYDLTYGGVTFTQSFDTTDEIDYAASGDFGTQGSEGYKGTYTGTSWATAGNANNLNKADGSLTFWFVPQQLTTNVKMTVYYNVVNTKTGTTHPDSDTINFGDLTRTKTETTTEVEGEDGETTTETTVEYGDYAYWKAGQLRTYTLKPQYVEVDIVDELKEYEKSNVVVTNNGNVYEYVRVNIIANWIGQLCVGLDENGQSIWEKDENGNDEQTVLMGYATKDGTTLVEAWNDKDVNANGKYTKADGSEISPLYTVGGVNYDTYGTFVNLPVKSTKENPTVNSHNWVRFDKYYYYTEPIGPNQSITNTLFDKYTVNPSPEFWIADKWGERRQARNVHLEMDLSVQAIPAPTDANGNFVGNYISAWTDALGGADLNDL